MPLYEYHCEPCTTTFQLLRPMSRSKDTAVCTTCGSEARRAISVFAAITSGGGMDDACFTGDGGFGCAAGGDCACID